MPREFRVPELGENVETASVAKVLVSEGDRVEAEQPVVELETDKAAAEVPIDSAGTIESVLVEAGDDVQVGQTILTLKDADADAEGASDRSASADKPSAAAKAEESPQAESTPRPERAEPGPNEPPGNGPRAADVTHEPEPGGPAPAAPSVRRFAREIGIDIETVVGSGPNGRISIEDVKAHARARQGNAAPPSGPSAAALPDFSQWGPVERRPASKVRRLTAERMSRAWGLVPQAVQFGRADLERVEALRQRFKQQAQDAGGHLSLTVLLVKIAGAALRAFPDFNTSYDPHREEIVYKDYVHIGVAMDTGRGLVVPVLRDVDRKSVIALSVELKDLTDRARAGKLGADDMQGGNLTITNAGALGGDDFIPIVNWPEAAILGIARSRVEAIYQGGEFRPKPLLPLALSYDHRLVDGADAVRFMRWIIDAVEDPVKLIVGA